MDHAPLPQTPRSTPPHAPFPPHGWRSTKHGPDGAGSATGQGGGRVSIPESKPESRVESTPESSGTNESRGGVVSIAESIVASLPGSLALSAAPPSGRSTSSSVVPHAM